MDSSKQSYAEVSGLSPERLNLIISAFNHASDGIMVTSVDGVILEVNHAFSRITGFAAKDIVGQKTSTLKSGVLSAEFYQQFWDQLLHHGHWSGEVWNKRKTGEVYPQRLSINAIRGDDGRIAYFVGCLADITENKFAEQQLQQLAYCDSLTGLHNRASLMDQLKLHVLYGRSKKLLAIAFIDLDGFKEINDTYGHDVGDYLLKEVAHRMKSFVRDVDVLARLGGDEFVLLMSDVDDRESAEAIVNRLLALINQEVRYNSIALQVSASIGLVFHKANNLGDPSSLLQKADAAMYRAKESGKNTYYVLD